MRDRLIDRIFTGHVSFRLPLIGQVTIYGANAMHWAINVSTKRWGYLCFHPTTRTFGSRWPWYFYASPNATPWAATFAMGPGVGRYEKLKAYARRSGMVPHDVDPNNTDVTVEARRTVEEPARSGRAN